MRFLNRFTLNVAVFVLCFFMVGLEADAKGRQLVVNWVPEVYSMSSPELLNAPGVRSAIANALTEKLRKLKASGKLPFVLNEGTGKALDSVRDDYSDAMPIGLVPLMMLDKSFKTEYHVGNDVFYRDIIASSLSVAVVSGDDESHSQRILAVVPMSGYTVLGTPSDLLRQPVSKDTETQTFIQLTTAMIDKELDFSSTVRALKDWETKQVLPDTYQVSDVVISSQGANEVFQSDAQKDAIKSVIANFFTSAYQKKSRNIVLPPVTAASAARNVRS